MKTKSFFKYFILLLTIGIVSCSSEDDNGGNGGNGGNGNEVTSITLSADPTSLFVDQSSTFTVTDNLGNNVTANATFSINGSDITNPYTFTASGTYNVVATYNDLTSSAVQITVTEPATSITLSTDASSYYQGQSATMTVLDNFGNDVTASAIFTIEGNNAASNPYLLNNAGSVDIVASYQALTSNTVSVTVNALPTYTTKIMLSDFTGTWCGACPIAGEAIHNLNNPNVIPVAFHNGDSMANSDSNAVDNAFNVTSYPTVLINGAAGQWSWSNFPTSELDPYLNAEANLGLGINSTVNGSNLDITVKVGFGLVNSAYKLTVYLVEDGFVQSQANYYVAGHPDPWPDYVHDDILRKSYTNPMGDAIPAGDITIGGEYVRSFNSVAITNVNNVANARIVAFVSDTNNNVINIQTAALGVDQDYD